MCIHPFLRWILLSALLGGCGAEVKGAGPPPPPTKTATKTFERSLYYGGESENLELTAKEQALIEKIGAEDCKMDPRLVLASRRHAADLLGRNGLHSSADIDHLRFALAASGSTDYMIQPFAVRLNDEGIEALSHFIDDRKGNWTHCGLGIGGDLTDGTAVWVGASRVIDFKRIPVSIPKGKLIKIAGKAHTASSSGVLAYLGLPDGSVQVLTVTLQADRRFSVGFVPKVEGRFELELVIDSGRGPETVSLLPLYVGVPPNSRPVVIPDETSDPLGEEPNQVLTALINDVRVKAGLPSLSRDHRLDKVAEAHSRDMVALGYFGHNSPRSGLLADRLKAQSLYPSEIAENVARSSSVRRVHRNLVRSPSHRLKLLSGTFTHLGVGIAEDGGDIVVTEILARW